MNVLLAIDGSAHSQRARELVAAIHWPAATRFEILYVEEEADPALPPERYLALHDVHRKLVTQLLAEATRSLKTVARHVDSTVLGGRPASRITSEARRIAADLIVVGSHGRGPFSAALLGSVAAEVVDHAPCPVLVARTATLRGAVLGADGSPGSRQAEAELLRWPFLRALPVRVVAVADLLPWFSGLEAAPVDATVYQQLIDDTQRHHRRIAAAAAKRLVTRGVRATAELREGSASQQLIDAAAEAHADVVVIGSRGHTGLARLLVGSTARGVLFHTRSSVLIARSRPPKRVAARLATHSGGAPRKTRVAR